MNDKNREADIIRLLAAGASNKMIAHELSICEATVKTHIRIIRARYGAQNRCKLVAVFLQKEPVTK